MKLNDTHLTTGRISLQAHEGGRNRKEIPMRPIRTMMLIVVLVLMSSVMALAERPGVQQVVDKQGFADQYQRDYNIFNPANKYRNDNPLNPANKYQSDNPFNPANKYDPGNPANPANKYQPDNPFNPANLYAPDNPVNPGNLYNPSTPFGPLGTP